jgi:predicted MFS family arabinose efflux permease
LIFLVNIPVGVAAALFAPRLVSADGRRVRSARLDVGGGLLITLAVASAVFAISEAPLLGWVQPLVLGGLCLAALALFGFATVERSHVRPLIDLRLLQRRGLRTAALLTFFVGAWTAGELVVMSVYLQQTLHDSPLVSGLVIAPQGPIGFITGMFGVRLVRRLGMRRLLVAAPAVAGTGFIAMSRLPAVGHYSALFIVVLLIGSGTVGTSFGATIMAASGMPAKDQGLVSGVVNTTRQVGAAVGVAVLVAIAEGAHARAGVATVGGDRTALLVAGLVALGGAFVAGYGTRPKRAADHRATVLVPPTLHSEIPTISTKRRAS